MILIDNNNHTDPPLNLAIEEYALRHLKEDQPYLLLYINEPSIIIGRNQNLFEEVNIGYVHNRGIPVFRRISGGGAVYHDTGNINFSFITDYEARKLNNYKSFNQPVIECLEDLGVNAYMDNRNAIRIKRDDRKISGNAQFSTSKRMISHGTLLFNADLEAVEQSLKADMHFISSRAQKSVRSSVANITDYLDEPMRTSEFRDYLITRLLQSSPRDWNTYRFTSSEWRDIQKLSDQRYNTWEWNVGKSPEFSFHRSRKLNHGSIDLDLKVKKGTIRDASLKSDSINGPMLLSIERSLQNTRYDPEEIKEQLDQLPIDELDDTVTVDELLELIYGWS